MNAPYIKLIIREQSRLLVCQYFLEQNEPSKA